MPATWALQFTLVRMHALERRGQIEIRRRPGVHAVGVILGEIAHAHVLHMDMLARRDRGGGEADDLAVTPHRLALPDRADRGLVAGGNTLRCRHSLADLRARQQSRACDHNAIVRVEADDRCGCHGTLLGIPSTVMRRHDPRIHL
jgi:hypothetical protein